MLCQLSYASRQSGWAVRWELPLRGMGEQEFPLSLEKYSTMEPDSKVRAAHAPQPSESEREAGANAALTLRKNQHRAVAQ